MTDQTDLTEEENVRLNLEDVRADRWALAYAVEQLWWHREYLRCSSAATRKNVDEELKIVDCAIDVLHKRDFERAVYQAFLENDGGQIYLTRELPANTDEEAD